MSGETPLDKRIKQVEDSIESYQKQSGVPSANLNWDEINGFLSITREQLGKMTPEDCGEIATMLAQASFYIQKTHNIEVAMKNWANNEINRLASKKIAQYDKFTPYEIKRFQIIEDDEAIKKLYNVFLESSKRADSLYMLSSQIKFMSQTLLEQQQTKRYNDGNRRNSTAN